MFLIKHLRSAEAVHRKLRAISAMLTDPSTTGHEKANAAALKTRLEQQLGKEAPAKAPWTDLMFRLGQTVKNVKQSAPPSPKGDWTDHAFRLGRAFRRSFDK
jgi:hypothetical protein